MTTLVSPKQRLGAEMETEALSLLEQKGFSLIEKNFHCKLGEIDLIMRDGPTLVFVEVRYRRSTEYGTPAETITFPKQRKLRRTAQYYLAKNGSQNVDCRFDVVTLLGPRNKLEVNWIKNAF